MLWVVANSEMVPHVANSEMMSDVANSYMLSVNAVCCS